MTVTIRPQTPEDDASVVEVWRDALPQFPHGSVEDYRTNHQAWIKRGLIFRRWVAEQDGRVVGNAELMIVESEEPDLYFLDVNVRPQNSGKGIGTQLVEVGLEAEAELGYKRLIAWFFEGEAGAERLAEKFGFTRSGDSEQQSRLDVNRANLTGFEGLEERLQADGIRIETLEPFMEDETFLRALYRVDMESHRDIPSSVPWKDLAYEAWFESAVLGPGRSPKWAWVALDGDTPIGVARLRTFPDGRSFNAYTGVSRSHRGRGVARALKYRTIQWSRENGIRYIYTGNEARNHRMLAINIALGYEMLPKAVEVERRFESAE